MFNIGDKVVYIRDFNAPYYDEFKSMGSEIQGEVFTVCHVREDDVTGTTDVFISHHAFPYSQITDCRNLQPYEEEDHV